MPHTPGPWVVRASEMGEDERFKVESDHYSDEAPGICGDHSKHWRLLECDARLIAAAPDLLAALKRLAGPNPGSDDRNAAHDAIAKAERGA